MQTIFDEGEIGDKMYVIQKGRVAILKKTGSTMNMVAELGPGDILGEMALVDKAPRSATAKTLEDTVLTVIDQEMFEDTLNVLPQWLYAIIRIMISRLRRSTSLKHFYELQTALPAVFLLLLQKEDTHSFEDLSQQINILHGLSAKKLQELMKILQKLELLEHDSNHDVTVKNPEEIEFLYEYLIANTNLKESLLKSEKLQTTLNKDRMRKLAVSLSDNFIDLALSLA